MGKIKRDRQKLHNAAVRPTQTSQSEPAVDINKASKNPCIQTSLLPSTSSFSKLDIDVDALSRRLGLESGTELDSRSAISGRSLKGLGLKKKDKMKLRHELWVKKVSVLEAHRQEARESLRRQKTAVVGDLKPLQDTLPTLELLLRDAGKRHTSNTGEQRKVRGIEKEAKRKKQMVDDIAVFQSVVTHPQFKLNPTATICEHLHNKIEMGDL